MPRILFIASHRPGRAPGQRFRFEQYIPHLEKNGWQCELSSLVNEADDKVLYSKGNYFKKARFVAKCNTVRSRDAARANDFDIIFLFREALMSRSIAFEQRMRKSRAKLIFDFDDAIWLPNVSDANRRWRWMKDPGKTPKLIALSDLILAGNQYLADYSKPYNGNVMVMPTTIDTEEYQPAPRNGNGPICIGWSGSITTIQHFKYALPALQQLKRRFGGRISFRVIGDGTFREPSLGIEGMPWRKDTEVADLNAIDIGIMPLPDDEWARGKCGLKGLQYMALGIPTLMSPVGVNGDIINDGENGFLAGTTEEWVEKVARLVEDADLRQRMGTAARRTVQERYSLSAWQDRYLQLMNDLISK
ncbi:MAG: glycosyltransferase family 4 protein [Flavobacteriales bacterium]